MRQHTSALRSLGSTTILADLLLMVNLSWNDKTLLITICGRVLMIPSIHLSVVNQGHVSTHSIVGIIHPT